MANDNISENTESVKNVVRTLSFRTRTMERFYAHLSEMDREIIRQLCEGIPLKCIAGAVHRSTCIVQSKVNEWRKRFSCQTNVALVNFFKNEIHETLQT